MAKYPYLGRARDGLRSIPAGEYIIIHRVTEDEAVVILHVVHGKRDIPTLFD